MIDGFKRSLGLNKRRNDGMAVKTLLESFRYPRQGPGMMWEAARDRVVEAGNRVLMGHSLQQLSEDKATGRWRVAARNKAGETVVINAGHVISSAPMRELGWSYASASRRRPPTRSISNTAISSPWH